MLSVLVNSPWSMFSTSSYGILESIIDSFPSTSNRASMDYLGKPIFNPLGTSLYGRAKRALRNGGFHGRIKLKEHCSRQLQKFSSVEYESSSSDSLTSSSNGRNHVVCMSHQKGRVGIYGRDGNISLASFGLKLKRVRQGQKASLTRSLSRLLPYIVLATAASALINPASFSWVSKDYYAPCLGGIMLSIGVQLSVSDFALIIQRPLPLLIGYISQYVIKPLLGFVIVRLMGVPSSFAAGLILTACVAGAQLSSYAAYLSNGDVALSIMLTSLTTISSIVVTPFLTKALIGSVVPVDVIAMGKSILQVVLIPVISGLLLNTYAKSLVDKVRPVMPVIAMVCTSLCIGSPLALNQARIVSTQGLHLLLPVVTFHAGAFVLGYWIAKLPFWRQESKIVKTISLCTGMQSSTLAMLLATNFLGGSHAVPPACSVVVMAIMGLTLASFWGKEKSAEPTESSIVCA